MAQQGMVLRNMQLVGRDTTPVKLTDAHKPAFEEGCYHIFARWTALQLGIQNQWGGANSVDKANSLLKEVIDWFYAQKDPDQADLEDLLDDMLQTDFNILADDDSPYQVSRSLINMYSQVARGDYTYLESLRAMAPAPTTACQEQPRPVDPEADQDDSSSSDDEDHNNDDAMDAEGDTAMGDADMEEDEMKEPSSVGAGRAEPIIDDDGFQVVQRKGRGGRR